MLRVSMMVRASVRVENCLDDEEGVLYIQENEVSFESDLRGRLSRRGRTRGREEGKVELTQRKETRFHSRLDWNPSFHRTRILVGERRRVTGCCKWRRS